MAAAEDLKQRRKSKENDNRQRSGSGTVASSGTKSESKEARLKRDLDKLKQLFRDAQCKEASELLSELCERKESETSVHQSSQESENQLIEYASSILPPLLSECKEPVSFVLDLVGEPACQRRKGSRLDLPVLLLRIAAESADGIRADHQKQATDLALTGKVTPKVVQTLTKYYGVKLNQDQLIAYGKKLLYEYKDYVLSADFMNRFKLHSHFPVADVLDPVIKKKQFDVVVAFVDHYPPAAQYAITHIAERREGEDPEKALKLIEKYGLKVSDFPRVMYLKKKDCVWWSVAIGKATEFSDFLVTGDVKLQRYLCRRLLKRANMNDLQLCVQYLKQYSLANDTEFKHVEAHYEQCVKDQKEGKPFVPAPIFQAPPSPTSPSAVAQAAITTAGAPADLKQSDQKDSIASVASPVPAPSPSPSPSPSTSASVEVGSPQPQAIASSSAVVPPVSYSPSPSNAPVITTTAPSPLVLPKSTPAATSPAPLTLTANATNATAATATNTAAATTSSDKTADSTVASTTAKPDKPYSNPQWKERREAKRAAQAAAAAAAATAAGSGDTTAAVKNPLRRENPNKAYKKDSKKKSAAAAREAREKAGLDGDDDKSTAATDGKVIMYDQLTMNEANIVVVNDEKTLELAGEYLRKADVIGVDLEHMPENFKGLHGFATTVQILQMATRDKTFVFDLQRFEALPGMDALFIDIFDSESIFKIGIGFDGDMHKLHSDFPHSACFQIQVQNYIELMGVEKRLPASMIAANPPATHTVVYTKELVQSTVHTELMQAELRVPTPAKKAKKEGGLAKLVRIILGKLLNKDEQISNWGRRPLRKSQLIYAALDAHCEVLLYDELFKLEDFDFDPITLDVE